MSSAKPTGGNPFSTRAALLLVLGAATIFVALLWMIGAGLAAGPANDGGNHGAGKGLNGYAALYSFLESRGVDVRRVRSPKSLKDRQLLILTPPHRATGEEIDKIVDRRRMSGPTIVVTPKWQTMRAPPSSTETRKGWVLLVGSATPEWPGFLNDVRVRIGKAGTGGQWHAKGARGTLPEPSKVLSGEGPRLVPLVTGGKGRILAAYIADGGHYPRLEAMALERPAATVKGQRRWPLIVVFEPDLLDNYGLSGFANAKFAEALVRAAMNGEEMPVAFDLTLNGHARKANLLTLAFTPPFLAATLCLLLAAAVIGWRAFLRFGPPRKSERAIAFGKRALVSNTAGLVRRARRLHLLTGPYAQHSREKISRALAIPRQPDEHALDAAIDRAIAARDPGITPFSQIAARLRGAKGPHQAVTAARELHALERKLIR
ncbi:MAG: DUF4350 domain-containing protein [Sphingomonadaceae bacterium]|nr:DUF4350 domain-containing protein [Sphingomonadaceae bacterium]